MGPVAMRRPLYVHLGNNLWKTFEKGQGGGGFKKKRGLHQNVDVSFKLVRRASGFILQTLAVSPDSFVFGNAIVPIKFHL